jgi:uncharacterized membrane protein YbhN (UPF0104 family)
MLKDTGIGAGLGALLGILLIALIEPANAGGVALLLFISVSLCTTIGGVLSLILRRKQEPQTREKE